VCNVFSHASANRFNHVAFSYERIIHFADTDAAGVVYFPNYLSICHEAYEEALATTGIKPRSFFADRGLVIPVSKSSADYLRPLYCGDKVRVTLKPELLTENSYAIEYEMLRLGSTAKLAATVRTAHVCIDSTTRERTALPADLLAWVQAG
jgi:1,4-dihydroxy-2-naphthoyl-CoA hydrolase